MPTEVELVAIGIGSVGRSVESRQGCPGAVLFYAVLSSKLRCNG